MTMPDRWDLTGSIADLAPVIDRIDILVNNAGLVRLCREG